MSDHSEYKAPLKGGLQLWGKPGGENIRQPDVIISYSILRLVRPVVEIIVDDEGGVGDESEHLTDGGGPWLVIPAECQQVTGWKKEVIRVDFLLETKIKTRPTDNCTDVPVVNVLRTAYTFDGVNLLDILISPSTENSYFKI